MTTLLRSLAGAVVLAGATLATWYVWLGRDTTYQLDGYGNASGPWTAGQVAGCALTLLVLLVGAVLLRVPWPVAAAAMTGSFTAAGAAQAAAADGTGLFMGGALLPFPAMGGGTAGLRRGIGRAPP